ncbi:MAG: hypothetical protein ABFD50_01525, partial [Smithella sp.]
CSPPRFTATQLPSAIGDEHSPKEDFHLFDRTRSRAHGFRVKPGMTKKKVIQKSRIVNSQSMLFT